MAEEVVARHRGKVGHVADHFVMVRMDSEGGGLDFLGQPEGRFVLVPLAFGDDHRPLGGDLLGGEVALGHPIGFEAQAEVDPVGGHGFVIGGPIQPGHRVPQAAFARDCAVEAAGREGGRALELHVLHPVGDAGEAGALVARADAVPHPQADQRRGMNFLEQHQQPVAQPGAVDAARGHRARSFLAAGEGALPPL